LWPTNHRNPERVEAAVADRLVCYVETTHGKERFGGQQWQKERPK
jgi:hypothetical protein